MAKTLLGENVSAYFDVKSCEPSKVGLFALGLMLLAHSSAQASTIPFNEGPVAAAQGLPNLPITVQSCGRVGARATGVASGAVAKIQPELSELLLSGAAQASYPVEDTQVEEPFNFDSTKAVSKLWSSFDRPECENQEHFKVPANFETSSTRKYSDQRLTTLANLERPESGRLISTSAADLTTPLLDARSDFSMVQDGAAISFSPKQGEGQDEQFGFYFVEPEEALNDRPSTTPIGEYRGAQADLMGQRGTDNSEETEDLEENPDIADPELGIIRIRSAVEDPELGIIRIREQIPALPSPSASAPAPIAFLTGRLSFVSSDNIFLSVDPVLGIVGDQFVRPGVSLGIYPSLAEQTFLIATADLNFQRYVNTRAANYDELRLRLGIRQGLTPRSYAQLSWSHQELFRPTLKNRFFENEAVELLLARRDALTPELALNSYYQIQMNFSAPQSFDRLIQFAGAYLSYQITPSWQVGVNYQLTLTDYTSFERFDTYQQVIGQLVYKLSPDIRMSLFGGISFGRSSVPSVRFDDTILGISFEGNWALF